MRAGLDETRLHLARATSRTQFVMQLGEDLTARGISCSIIPSHVTKQAAVLFSDVDLFHKPVADELLASGFLDLMC